MKKKLLALSLLIGAAASAPAFAVDWNSDISSTAEAIVKVIQDTSVGITVDNQAELSGDVKAGTTLFRLALRADSSTPSVIVLGASNNILKSGGLLNNSLTTSDGSTRNGLLTAKLEGTGPGNYELINDVEYFPEGTYEASSAHVFKMTDSETNTYSLTATSAEDVLASELVSGLYAYHFVANSYTE
ncbi:hypothetical protein RJE46_13605 [Cedecea neteri]|uniref:hypothetical protein n=1 Tax=Cedecea neteri TaxID=158822 RepID=UPI002892DFE3|nr:hypothetical protein [Cedecea neteri]WNJ77675.1 hypothetical protein RJE46_13605 [Cedecea neteri]